jgi:hypothetical protein
MFHRKYRNLNNSTGRTVAKPHTDLWLISSVVSSMSSPSLSEDGKWRGPVMTDSRKVDTVINGSADEVATTQAIGRIAATAASS